MEEERHVKLTEFAVQFGYLEDMGFDTLLGPFSSVRLLLAMLKMNTVSSCSVRFSCLLRRK